MGGDDPVPENLEDALNRTPAPPSGPVPTQDPNLPGFVSPTRGPTPKGPDSVEVLGAVIPIPEGATYFYGRGPETRLLHRIWLGDSTVKFDDYGLTSARIEAPDREELEATLDALWTLTQAVGTPSPPSLEVKGVQVPLPVGSYYRTTENPHVPGEVGRFRVTYRHSVLFFDEHGVIYARVGSGDEARFQPAIDALAIVGAQE